MGLELFPSRIKSLREKKGMRQKDFAKAIGISSATLSAYEKSTGGVKPSLDTLVKIAETFHVSLDWLCGLTDSETMRGQIETYGDVIRLLLQISLFIDIRDDLREGDHAGGTIFPGSVPCGVPYIGFPIRCLNEFLQEWISIKELHDHKTIDDEVYGLWCEKTLRKYDDMYIGFRKEPFEEVPSDGTEV